MTAPKYIPGRIDYWLWAALTEFINGFIAGLGGGSVVGVGVGTTTATTDLGAGISPGKQVLISLAGLVLTAVGNGLKRVIVWHDQHPFPNPFPETPPSQPPLAP